MLRKYSFGYFFLVIIGGLAISTTFYIACNRTSSQQSNQSVPVQKQQIESESSPKQFNPIPSINSAFFDFLGQLPNGVEAWNRFMENNRYRIANESDFELPEAVLQKDTGHLHSQNQLPVLLADINNDGLSKDFAVIIVDTTIKGKNRFGIIIFNQPESSELIPQQYWLYKENDLSKSVFTYSRDGLGIRTYKDDGTYDLCSAKWDKKYKKYSCE